MDETTGLEAHYKFSLGVYFLITNPSMFFRSMRRRATN